MGTEGNTTMTVGPFTWERRDNGDCECWDLVQDPDAAMTHWAVKNYGGEPGPGFRGWKLVSSGPFDEPGAWSTCDDAMRGVVPWLVRLIEREVAERIEHANKAAAALYRVRDALANTEQRA